MLYVFSLAMSATKITRVSLKEPWIRFTHRRVMSSRFPMGVPTKYNPGGRGSSFFRILAHTTSTVALSAIHSNHQSFQRQ